MYHMKNLVYSQYKKSKFANWSHTVATLFPSLFLVLLLVTPVFCQLKSTELCCCTPGALEWCTGLLGMPEVPWKNRCALAVCVREWLANTHYWRQPCMPFWWPLPWLVEDWWQADLRRFWHISEPLEAAKLSLRFYKKKNLLWDFFFFKRSDFNPSGNRKRGDWLMV